jgi:hypothetical protein
MTLSKFINILKQYEKTYGDCIITTSNGRRDTGLNYSPFTEYLEVKQDGTFVTIHIKKEL